MWDNLLEKFGFWIPKYRMCCQRVVMVLFSERTPVLKRRYGTDRIMILSIYNWQCLRAPNIYTLEIKIYNVPHKQFLQCFDCFYNFLPGCTCATLLIIFLLIFIFLVKRIRIAIELIKEASRLLYLTCTIYISMILINVIHRNTNVLLRCFS